MGGVPLPEGYHSVNPYIVVDDADRLIHFLVEVFGAVEQGRALRHDGRIDHADVRIGDSLVMLSEASEVYPARMSRVPLNFGGGPDDHQAASTS
jgi:PhnB protein